MRKVEGFPAKARFTPVPDLFFSAVLPDIDDLAELKVTLHVIWSLYRKRGYPRFVTLNELAAGMTYAQGMAGQGLRSGLEKAVSRGTLLHLSLEREGIADELYFVNNEEGKRSLAGISNGEINIGGVIRSEPCQAVGEKPNIFALYERNIGLLTPIIADELKEAEKLYPASWIEDAFKEAIELNRRSWRYISRILERWATEGKGGEPGRDSETDARYKEYLRKYGHLLQRQG